MKRFVKTIVISAMTLAAVMLLPISVYAYTVTVEGGIADKNTADAGETVSIKADHPVKGRCFRYWYSDDAVFDSAGGKAQFSDDFETTFTMPSKDVTVSAKTEVIEMICKDTVSTDYTGELVEPEYKIQLGGVDLLAVQDTDYEMSYKDNINAGTATATVTLIGKFVGTADTTFTINPVSISGADVKAEDRVYDGSEQKPAVKVTLKGKQLKDDDYTVTYSDNVNAGNAHVTVTGRGNYLDTTSAYATFKISPADISKAEVMVEDQIYSGQALKPDVNVVLNGKKLKADDYTVSYSDNTEPGTAHVTVTGRGNCLDTTSVKGTFKIYADISEAEVTLLDQVYNGKKHEPVPNVIWRGKKLGEENYVLSYSDNVNAGTALVTVTGKGIFLDTTSAKGRFKIEKRPVTITVESAKKIQGSPDPAFRGKVEGLINADDLGVITYDRKGNDEKPGTYIDEITAFYTPNPNYRVTVNNGDLTIEGSKREYVTVLKMNPKGKKGLTLAWNKTPGAAGYDIFMSRCNHGGKKTTPKRVKTIKGNETFQWTATGLKPNKSYKAYVRAYIKDEKGKKEYISKSPLMHVYTSGGNKTYTNAKSIKINTSDGKIKKGNKLSLDVEETYKIKATVNKSDKKKKLLPNSHVRTLRYRSSDPKVASVGSSGKITARMTGKCKIYVYAHNGVSKTISVTVR